MAYTSSFNGPATGAATDLAKLLAPIAGILSGIAAVATLAALFGGNNSGS